MGIGLKNVMEAILLQRLDETISKMDCCKCDRCYMDIASYALNRLPPKYVVTKEGEVYSKLDTLSVQYDMDLVSAIVQGVEAVKKHPHHTAEDIELMLDRQKAAPKPAAAEKASPVRAAVSAEQTAEKAGQQKAAAEAAKAAAAQPAPDMAADALAGIPGLEGIDLSDLPADLPNMEELLSILNTPDETGG